MSDDELVGSPLEDVPPRQPEDHCNARRSSGGTFQGYCQNPPGKGTDHLGEGRCTYHGGDAGSGGERDGSGAPDDNTNAVSHGLYAETNRFYQEVLDDDLQMLCDEIFKDYLADYRERHCDDEGDDIPLGHESRLFEIAVNHAKIIHADNWAVDKPDDLQSGNPMVDRETRKKGVQDMVVEEIRYRESVIVGTQQKLRREDRAWLKDFGLLEDSAGKMADALAEGIDLNLSSEDKEVLDAAFNTDPQT